jgi:hypothetical protein
MPGLDRENPYDIFIDDKPVGGDKEKFGAEEDNYFS